MNSKKQYHKTNQLAEGLRRQWGIDNYAPIDIFSLVNQKMPNRSSRRVGWFLIQCEANHCVNK